MNQRLLTFALIVQALFAGALLYLGFSLRENRKHDYLELTHRVTAGYASAADLEKLASFLPDRADKAAVRALFGLPASRSNSIELADKSELKGEFWIYYPVSQSTTADAPSAPIDSADAEKMSGAVSCLLIEFDERGRATAHSVSIVHPIRLIPSPPASK